MILTHIAKSRDRNFYVERKKLRSRKRVQAFS